jgi:pyruvate/2-oxoglutarate dehydrogenase complex dihydrolipoamide dehydrogenase (E3) component
VLEADRPLAKDDPECGAIVLDALAREGVAIRSGVVVRAVEADRDGGVRITLGGEANGETIAASHLLVAAGRRANLDGLGLEAAGIKYDPRGVLVDAGLRTSNRRVYAVGDAVAGAPQFTHVASHHASLVIRNALFRLPIRVNHDMMPRVTFTDPELAHVGLTQEEAKRRGRFNVLRWPYHDNDRAQAERATRGHIKVVTTPRGRILGATIVGAQAGELIAVWSLAVAQRMSVRALAGTVLPYPTLAEIGKMAAIGYYTPRLTNPLLQRIIGWLRRLG